MRKGFVLGVLAALILSVASLFAIRREDRCLFLREPPCEFFPAEK